MLKVGDTITIKQREPGKDYPFSFIDDMACLAGHRYVISAVFEDEYDPSDYSDDFKDGELDGCLYELEGSGWDWCNAMIEIEDSNLWTD